MLIFFFNSSMWEDERNYSGGRWTNNGLYHGPTADSRWLDLLLTMIGDTVHNEHGHMVNGAVFSVRKNYGRTSIWLDNCSHIGGITAIGR